MRWFSWLGFVALALTACASDVETVQGVKCGPVTCGEREYCCDASCGICEAEAVACTDTCAE